MTPVISMFSVQFGLRLCLAQQRSKWAPAVNTLAYEANCMLSEYGEMNHASLNRKCHKTDAESFMVDAAA